MTARKRFVQERPFAATALRIADDLVREPAMPDAQRTAALGMIAYALLDLSDAVRQHGRDDER